MKKPPNIAGGCQCGNVRYQVHGKLQTASICHCRMCQKAFGSFCAALVKVAESDLKFTRGTAAEFRSSAIVARGFCQNCGTPLYLREDGDNCYEMAIGSLDNPQLAPPTHQVGIESKLDWTDRLHELPGHTTMEDRTPEELARLASLQHPDFDL